MKPELTVNLASPVPPYEQIRQQVAALAAGGVLRAGDRLPTIRMLAADLGVAPGTVARAYKELEADGIVTAMRRRGTVVTAPPATGPAAAGPPATARLEAAVEAVVRLGRALDVSDDALLDMLRQAQGAAVPGTRDGGRT